jgi:DNA-binding transcriptional LysR family regulator
VDWDDLRILLALADGGSLAGAGARLGVHKSTVQRRLDALAQGLRAPLVRRDAHGYHLTPAGLRAVETARAMASLAEGLRAELATAAETEVVRVTAPVWFCRELLIPALPAFRAAQAGVEVQLLASDQIVDLRREQVDVAIRNLAPTDPDLGRQRAGEIGLALYAAPAYLARMGRPSRREELAAHEFVGFEGGLGLSTGFRWVDALGPRLALRASDALAHLDAARHGIGVALLPCLLGDADAGLCRLDEVGPPTAEVVWLVVPADRRAAPAVRATTRWIVSVFAANQEALWGRGARRHADPR